MRKALVTILVLALAGLAALAAAVRHGAEGYFSPQFTPDGEAVVVVVRQARALVLGLGYDMWTPPARVRVTHDRFSIVRVAVADGGTKTLQAFPASPVEGQWIQTYRPGVYGSAEAHLRWATPEALEYKSVSRSRVSRAATRTSLAAAGIATNASGSTARRGSAALRGWEATRRLN